MIHAKDISCACDWEQCFLAHIKRRQCGATHEKQADVLERAGREHEWLPSEVNCNIVKLS